MIKGQLTVKGQVSACQTEFDKYPWKEGVTTVVQKKIVGLRSNNLKTLQAIVQSFPPRYQFSPAGPEPTAVDHLYSIHQQGANCTLYYAATHMATSNIESVLWSHLTFILGRSNSRALCLPGRLARSSTSSGWVLQLFPYDLQQARPSVLISPSGVCRSFDRPWQRIRPAAVHFTSNTEHPTLLSFLHHYGQSSTLCLDRHSDYLKVLSLLCHRLPLHQS